ncbi:MAG: DUF4058 family protein [Gemmataceae bacterium]|nr:DUF4058 family protein [Gemmataceae bacterium]
MSSPFPGMDPYLEDPAFWADFHHRFLDCWCEAVADALPGNYDARLDESVNLVQLSPAVVRLVYPDVAVSRGPRRTTRSRPNGRGTMLLEPVTIPHEYLDEVRQARIEILHRPERTLVAVLEMLSPFSKTGDGFEQHRSKRKTILTQNVHLVELDLLVGGRRLPHAQPLPAGDYYALLSRVDNRPDCAVYCWTVRDPLPTIPIPLKAPDADIHVDLAKVFRVTYQRGRYARSLPYAKPPVAPLDPESARWAMRRAAKNKRSTRRRS